MRLGQGIDLARETERREARQRAPVEATRGPQPRELGLGEPSALEELQDLLEAGREQEVALRRQLADEELEHGRVGHARLEIGGVHVQLVEVGQQQARCRVDAERACGVPELIHRDRRLRVAKRQLPNSTGSGASCSMWRVTPPKRNSRSRVWP